MISKKGHKSILQPYSIRKQLVDSLTFEIYKTLNLTVKNNLKIFYKNKLSIK